MYGEELELELHAVKHQMQNVENANADMKRYRADPPRNFLQMHALHCFDKYTLNDEL